LRFNCNLYRYTLEERVAPVERAHGQDHGRGVDPTSNHLVGPHHLLQQAMPTVVHRTRLSLPLAAVRRLARRGGIGEFEPEECTYGGGWRGGRGWVRRTVRSAWRGEVERARSAAALALQLRAFDAHVRWEGLKRPPAPGTNKSAYKSKKAEKAEKAALQALMLQAQDKDKAGLYSC
jgi:hypothetical protein